MSLLNLHDYVRLALSHAVFVPNDDGSWTVEITVLPGCVTWGKTRAEAALMAEDAAEGWLLTALQFGDEIPVIDGFALNQVLTTDTQETTMVYESKLGAGGDLMLREASAYFAGAGALRSSLRRLAERLEQEGIAYALLGGLALGEHGYPRMTEDIDVLLTPAGLQLFRERCVGRGYRPAFNGAQKTFRDTETGVRIEFLTAGAFPGDGLPKPVVFPDPAAPGVSETHGDIRVISLEKLIELKLASGLSAPHRLRDLADVQDLILRLQLPLHLADEIDPSVQPEYRRLWQQAQSGIENQDHPWT